MARFSLHGSPSAKMSNVSLLALLCISAFLFSSFSYASSNQFEASWKGWVEERHRDIDCPWVISAKNQRICNWSSSLDVELTRSGMNFSMKVDVFSKDAFVALPGSQKYWPANVKANGLPATIVERNHKPYVVLVKGSYQLKGNFRWQSQPAVIQVPDVAFISLTKNGKTLPVTLKNGQLLIASEDLKKTTQVRDSLKVDVYRLLRDGVPMMLDTHVVLSVGGSAREVTLGKLLLKDSELTQFKSSLPAKVEDDGLLRVQLKPGVHRVQVIERFKDNLSELKTNKVTDNWPNIEYLSFQSNTDIREVLLSGAESIDTSLIDIPRQWQRFPTYKLTSNTVLDIETLEKGENLNRPNKIEIKRNIWIGFEGDSATVFDEIEGEMYKDWRLNANTDMNVGRAVVDEEPVLITTADGQQGIEIRSPHIQMQAVSRLTSPKAFSVVGWQTDADKFSARIHLPPGWRVLHASGVDGVRGTWLQKWDLWDVFWVMILLAATHRLLGIKLAGLMAVTLFFTYHESGSPIVFWAFMLLAIALLPKISGTFKRVVSYTGSAVSFIFVLSFIAIAVTSIRLAIYPTLERHSVGHYDIYNDNYSSVSGIASSLPKAASTMAEKSFNRNEDSSIDLEEIVVTARKREQSLQDNPLALMNDGSASKQQKFYEIDENDRVQTGPGMPTWTWSSLSINTSSMVSVDQTLNLTYSTPFMTSLWRILNVVLIGLLGALILLQFFKRAHFGDPDLTLDIDDAPNSPQSHKTATPPSTVSSISLLIMSTVLTFGVSISDKAIAASDVGYPPKYLLKELEERITKTPECLPGCLSLNNGKVSADKNALTIQFEAHVVADVAVPVPSGVNTWNPTAVVVNGKAGTVSKRAGVLSVLLPKGRHSVTLSGALSGDRATINIPTPIHNLSAESQYWLIDGLVDGRAVSGSLNLSIKQSASEMASENKKSEQALSQKPAKPFVIVHRSFELGKQWRVHTRVARLAPQHGAMTVDVNLFDGEQVLSDTLVTKDGVGQVQFSANQRVVSWESALSPVEALKLTAANHSKYLETWRFIPSSIWRIRHDGIPPVKARNESEQLNPYWKPWPGEQLTVHVSRPEGVPGEVYTVESAHLVYTAGDNLQKSELELTILASQGDKYQFSVPKDAEITSISLDQKAINIPQSNLITVQLTPGQQLLRVEFQQRKTMSFASRTPMISLPGDATNINVQYQLPRDRWLLYLTGPTLGAAMLYWGVLFVILFGAVALWKLSQKLELSMPVTLTSWLLLGLGLSTVNGYGVILVALFFFVLAYRNQKVHPSSLSRVKFNWLQAGIVALTVITVLSVLFAIPAGLLSSPNMQVTGNGSSSHWYKYYQDFVTAGDFPQVSVFSVSMMVYRIVMLAWSLWIATQLLTWGSWWLKSCTQGGFWHAPKKAN